MRILSLLLALLLSAPAAAQVTVVRGGGTAGITGGTIDGAVIGGTTPAAITGTTVSVDNGTAGEKFVLRSRAGIGIPVPHFIPSSTGVIAFDLMPKGSPSDFSSDTGTAWIDITSAEVTDGSANFESLRMGKYATGATHIGSAAGGTGTLRALLINKGGGNVGINVAPSGAAGDGGLNIGGWGGHVVTHTGSAGAYHELGTTAADADATNVGLLAFVGTSQAATHKTIANIFARTSGTTATQRGGEIVFSTKANGSTTVTNQWKIDNVGILTGVNSAAQISLPAGTASLTSLNWGTANVGLYTVGGFPRVAVAGGAVAQFGGSASTGLMRIGIISVGDPANFEDAFVSRAGAASVRIGSTTTGTDGTLTLGTLAATTRVRHSGFTFSNIATNLANNGDVGYCSDCTIANPCAGSGTGAFAKRLNGVNVCN